MTLSSTRNIHSTRLSLAIHITTVCHTVYVSQDTYVFQNSVAKKKMRKYFIYAMNATDLSPYIYYQILTYPDTITSRYSATLI